MTNTESRTVSLEELPPWDDADTLEHGKEQITEEDVRELAAYGFDSDHRTLVGLGPVERARRARKAAEIPDSQRMPQSEPPGPFIADDVDDAELLRSLRGGRLGPWLIAVPAALVVVAAVAVAVVRGFAAPAASKPAVVAAAAPATAGLEVKLPGVTAHVLVDGEDRGPLPVLLRGLKPGSHVVSIADPAYALYSQSVLLTANQVRTLEPELTFVRGVIRISAGEGAEGAEVEVIGANERREIQRLPARLEVAPGEYRIRGTRKGYAPFASSAVLSGTNREVDVNVELARQAAVDEPVAATPLSQLPCATVPALPGATSTGIGAIDITSSPPANVVLDGRPLGRAPCVVQVPAGPHTVVFIHPKYGRQSRNVNVGTRQTASASAAF